jgi:hypothetical protein
MMIMNGVVLVMMVVVMVVACNIFTSSSIEIALNQSPM